VKIKAAVAVPRSTTLAVFTTISEKSKHTSSSAVQMKNQRGTTTIEEKLDAISRMEKVNELLT